MNVRPIVETCRIRKLMKLGCYGCEYKGSACKNFKELLNVRCPGKATKLAQPVAVSNAGISAFDNSKKCPDTAE